MGQIQDEIQADLRQRMASAGELEVPSLPPVERVKMRQMPKAETVFFFERSDGTILDMNEQQAAIFMKGHPDIRLVGTGDGLTYQAYMKAHLPRFDSLPVEDSKRISQEAFEAELAEARKHPRIPIFQEVSFLDNSISPAMRKDFNPALNG